MEDFVRVGFAHKEFCPGKHLYVWAVIFVGFYPCGILSIWDFVHMGLFSMWTFVPVGFFVCMVFFDYQTLV